MSAPVPDLPPTDNAELSFLQPETPRSRALYGRAALLSVAAHGLLLLLFTAIPSQPVRLIPEPAPLPTRRQSTPLIAPVLTQRAPNATTPSKSVNLDSLLAEARRASVPVPTPRRAPVPGRAATQSAPRPVPAPPAPAKPEPPKPQSTPLPPPPGIETAQARPLSAPIGAGATMQGMAAPPPPTQPPKLAFETPGSGQTQAPRGLGRVPVPSSSVEETMRSVARGSGAGLAVGDMLEGGLPDSPLRSPSQSRTGSRLELLSDPQGVDFKPYLIRVLAVVRRNWFAVIPESARYGRRGKTVVQFAISRDGRVPKLVIAIPSGADPLDRAAVAGISASNPFPPLPTEFKGEQVRLQLSFSYNVQ